MNWTWEHDFDGDYAVFEDDEPILCTYGVTEEDKKRARLAAAAPTLVHAIKGLLGNVDHLLHDDDEDCCVCFAKKALETAGINQ